MTLNSLQGHQGSSDVTDVAYVRWLVCVWFRTSGQNGFVLR